MVKREGDLTSGFEAVASASDILEPSELAAMYLFINKISTAPASSIDRDTLNELNSFLGSSIVTPDDKSLGYSNQTLSGLSGKKFVNGHRAESTAFQVFSSGIWGSLAALYKQAFLESKQGNEEDKRLMKDIAEIIYSRVPENEAEEFATDPEWQMITYLLTEPDYWQKLIEMRNTEEGQEASINIASLQRPSGGEPMQDDCIELEAEEIAYRVDTLLRFLGYDDSYNPDKYTITNFVTNSSSEPSNSEQNLNVAIHHDSLDKFKSLGANLVHQAEMSLDFTGHLPSHSKVVLRLEKPDGTALELSASGQLISTTETGERLESKDCGWKLAFFAKCIMVE